MKNLILIGGTMGVGKTTVSRALQGLLPGCVFLDGDWCWDMRPFTVNEETKAMVQDNIVHLLRNFLRCSVFQNVVFCWVMHEQSIIDGLLEQLSGEEFRLCNYSLTCPEEALRRRLEKDVREGKRTPDVIARSTARLPFYEKLNTRRLDVGSIPAVEAAAAIPAPVREGQG